MAVSRTASAKVSHIETCLPAQLAVTLDSTLVDASDHNLQYKSVFFFLNAKNVGLVPCVLVGRPDLSLYVGRTKVSRSITPTGTARSLLDGGPLAPSMTMFLSASWDGSWCLKPVRATVVIRLSTGVVSATPPVPSPPCQPAFKRDSYYGYTDWYLPPLKV